MVQVKFKYVGNGRIIHMDSSYEPHTEYTVDWDRWQLLAHSNAFQFIEKIEDKVTAAPKKKRSRRSKPDKEIEKEISEAEPQPEVENNGGDEE